jgi:hypothetical protein
LQEFKLLAEQGNASAQDNLKGISADIETDGCPKGIFEDMSTDKCVSE